MLFLYYPQCFARRMASSAITPRPLESRFRVKPRPGSGPEISRLEFRVSGDGFSLSRILLWNKLMLSLPVRPPAGGWPGRRHDNRLFDRGSVHVAPFHKSIIHTRRDDAKAPPLIPTTPKRCLATTVMDILLLTDSRYFNEVK